jgi:PTH1 family peptidyl-tRNA hydrolase
LNWLNLFKRKTKNSEMKKFLIIGIGNIGNEYDDTRHNIGFQFLNCISEEFKENFSTVKYGQTCKFNLKGKSITLLKPSTYVNLSGKAVRYWLNKENIDLENILVISDDLNLEFGRIRLKPNGSDGGHNGLKDITNSLNTSNYSRLRFGIGGDFPKGKQSEYVLSKWNKEEISKFIEIEPLFTEIIKSFVTQGIDETMNKFNC